MRESGESKSEDLYKTSLSHRLLPNLIAGGGAGAVTDIIFFPFETIKTRLQTSKTFLRVSTFKNVYKGLTPQLTITFPAASSYFMGYESTKFVFDSQVIPNDLSLIQKSMLGGVSAETCRVILCNPFEIVKQQLQVGQHQHMTEAIKYLYNKQGVRGLYRGFWSLLAREIPFSCIQMPLYEVNWLQYYDYSAFCKLVVNRCL